MILFGCYLWNLCSHPREMDYVLTFFIFLPFVCFVVSRSCIYTYMLICLICLQTHPCSPNLSMFTIYIHIYMFKHKCPYSWCSYTYPYDCHVHIFIHICVFTYPHSFWHTLDVSMILMLDFACLTILHVYFFILVFGLIIVVLIIDWIFA